MCESFPLCRNFDGLANIAPTGEIPFIRKSATLDRLNWLDAAVATFEENTGAIRLIDQSQSVASWAETSELLNEVVFA